MLKTKKEALSCIELDSNQKQVKRGNWFFIILKAGLFSHQVCLAVCICILCAYENNDFSKKKREETEIDKLNVIKNKRFQPVRKNNRFQVINFLAFWSQNIIYSERLLTR